MIFFHNSHSSARLSLKHVAEGGNLAEEVISTVRTAHAFGAQAVLATLYDGFINKSLRVDMKAAVWHGSGLGVFFFVIYSSYALGSFVCFPHISSANNLFVAFYFGTTLINQGHGEFGCD